MTPSVRLNVLKCFLTDCSKEIVSCLISHVHGSCEYFLDREMKRNKTTWVDHAISRQSRKSRVPIFLLPVKSIHVHIPPPLTFRKVRINDAGSLTIFHGVIAVHYKISGISKLYWMDYRDKFIWWFLKCSFIVRISLLVYYKDIFSLSSLPLILRMKVYSVRSEF